MRPAVRALQGRMGKPAGRERACVEACSSCLCLSYPVMSSLRDTASMAMVDAAMSAC